MNVRAILIVLLALVLALLLVTAQGLATAGATLQVAEPNEAMLTLTADGAVHAWPSNATDFLGSLPFRVTIPTNARTPDAQWWRIPYPNGPDGYGWLSATVVRPNAAAAHVPLIEVIFATPTPEPPTPAPTPPPCQYNSAFVADVTVPDGTEIGPAQTINKVWRLRNTGTCAWEAGTLLTFAGGFQMSAPGTVLFPYTAPGGTVDIGVTLYAPSAPGQYRGLWQLRNTAAQVFGTQVSVVIRVPSPVAPTPVPPPPPVSQPGPSINFWTDRDRVKEGQCTTIHWDVRNVREVYLDYGGRTRGVVGQGSKGVCPSSDGKTYVLRVNRYDGSQTTRTVVINIDGGGGGGGGKFYATRTTISKGECTDLVWNVPKGHKAWLNDERVGVSSRTTVCPRTKTRYRLLVNYNENGSKRDEFTVTINIK